MCSAHGSLATFGWPLLGGLTRYGEEFNEVDLGWVDG